MPHRNRHRARPALQCVDDRLRRKRGPRRRPDHDQGDQGQQRRHGELPRRCRFGADRRRRQCDRLPGEPRRRREHDQGEGGGQRRRDHPDLHSRGDAGGGRHHGTGGLRSDRGRNLARRDLRRGARPRGEPRQQRLHGEKPRRGPGGDGRARRLALDWRCPVDADARRGGGLHRHGDGELHQADLGHGERARGCRRQRGGVLHRPGGDQQHRSSDGSDHGGLRPDIVRGGRGRGDRGR